MTHRLATLALVLAAAATAHADVKAEAGKHIAAATEFHQQRRWQQALDELAAAYALDPQPPLLYAIGQLHVALGRCDLAITFYERFIATKPAAAQIAKARGAIDVCKTNPPPPEPGPDPEPKPVEHPDPPAKRVDAPVTIVVAPQDRPWYTDTAGDVLVGAGVAATAAAVIFYRAGLADLDAADAATTYPAQSSAYDDAQRARTIAFVAGGAGIALVAAGVVHYAMHGHRAHDVAVAPASGGAVVTLGGRF